MAGCINNGRGTIFDRNSAVKKDDPFAQNSVFRSNCRGTWVAILQDQEEKPAIGGIPKSLRDRFGDAVNDLIQPKKPTKRQQTEC